MTRALMTWDRPHHLSDAEAQDWVRTAVRRLATIPNVRSVTLSRSAVSRRYRPSHDWICELHLSDDASADALLADPVCAEWLRDLRALGMRPGVAVLEATETVTPNPDDPPGTVSRRMARERAHATTPG